MLAFVLFFAALVVPTLLISGIVVASMRPPTAEPRVRFQELTLPVYTAQPAGTSACEDSYLRVPSSLVIGTTWSVHLN